MEVGLIANLENRRAQLFCDAAAKLGVRSTCLSWQELLENRDTAERSRSCDLLRIESAGENDRVATLLAERGGSSEASLQFGEIGALEATYRGFCSVLYRLKSLDRPCMNSPSEIQVMFDKWRSHQRFVAADVPRPRTTLAPLSYQEFLAQLGTRGRVFLKPLHGSSASGVCALRWAGRRRHLIAPIEIVRDGEGWRFFNTLKVRSYTSKPEVEAILGFLLPQKMVCEDWIPKATLGGRGFDLRIVVIAGQARHTVLRTSVHPMTNLHLGSERGCLDSLVRNFRGSGTS